MQFTGRRFDEATLLRIADTYEREAPWYKEQPPAAA
jgi:Asp-tRNA(Asn)/Glu-tRNA(Gln) amidotransferase A subunit family amidase